jgi:hypothetical protein
LPNAARRLPQPTIRFPGRAIDNRQSAFANELAVAEGFEPSHGRINNAVPYQLGYATEWDRRPALRLEATKGVEPLSFGLQDRRSFIQLSYIAEGIWWS